MSATSPPPQLDVEVSRSIQDQVSGGVSLSYVMCGQASVPSSFAAVLDIKSTW